MVSIEALIPNEYLNFLIIIVASVVFSWLAHFILNRHVKKIVEKTKQEIDDEILKVSSKPLHTLIISIGLYIALKSLSILTPYTIWLDGGFFVLIALVISWTISRILKILISHWIKVQHGYEKAPEVISKIISMIVYLITILIILAYFRIEITPLIAALGLGGVAVGLALQSTLSDFFAGINIVTDRPIKVGDFVDLEGNILGEVEDIGWRTTKIKVLGGDVAIEPLVADIIIIPNSKLSNSIIKNYSVPSPRTTALVECGVSYKSDLRKVEKITLDVAKKIQGTFPGAVKDAEPAMMYKTFGDSNINFIVILRVENIMQKRPVIHEFIKALKERYDKEGIEISWPIRKIYYGNNEKL